ncbi:MAG: DUF2784 family protein [Spirochaetota bacterium]
MAGENTFLLLLGDYFFLWFHAALVLFNLFGWIWKPLRTAHLISIGLTAGSWFILGLFYGIGYCPLTEWHFNILEALGDRDLPHSYITYLIRRMTGLDPPARLVEIATVAGLFLAAGAALTVRAVSRRRAGRPGPLLAALSAKGVEMRVYYTSRNSLLARGILSLVIGIIVVALPEVTLALIAIFFAALLLINGATMLLEGVRTTGPGRGSIVGLGIIAAVVGLGAILWPEATITVLALLLGVWAVVHGSYDLWTAVQLRQELPGAVFLGLLGFLAVVFGVTLFFYPLAGAQALAIVLGIYAIASGILLTAAGLRS